MPRPRFRMNCPYPGGQVMGPGGGRIVRPGDEFDVEPDVQGGPHNMWVPLNAEARAMFETWNRARPLDKRRPYPFQESIVPSKPSREE